MRCGWAIAPLIIHRLASGRSMCLNSSQLSRCGEEQRPIAGAQMSLSVIGAGIGRTGTFSRSRNGSWTSGSRFVTPGTHCTRDAIYQLPSRLRDRWAFTAALYRE